jgi:hypothetical protein
MTEVLDFVNSYLDEEYSTHELDTVAKDKEPVFEAFKKMIKAYFATHGILPTNEYLHAGNPPPPARRKARRAEIRRRPLFKIARYGKGKSELYRAYMGDFLKSDKESYYQTIFIRKQPKPKIVALYSISPDLWSGGLIEWVWKRGEKIVVKRLGKPVEVTKIEPPAEKASLADYNADE